MSNCLELTQVSKSYADFALHNISFSLPKGYIMGLVGSNGAGKTTTIELILNLIEKNSGEITIFGKDNIACERELKQEIGVVFDRTFFVEDWTIIDTEKAISPFYDSWSHQTFEKMRKRFKLPKNKKIKELSRGMQMKLMLACALSRETKLLLLDEPTSGLDPVTRDDFLEILQEYIQDGERSVLFSTHITSDLDQVADYITFLNNGELVFAGSVDELREKYRVIKGNPEDLTADLQEKIIGLRKTGVGFEGLIATQNAPGNQEFILDVPSINDVVVYVGKEN